MTQKQSIAMLLCIAGLSLPLLWLFHCEEGHGPVVFLFTGKAFAADRPIITGGALDQPSLHKEFFIFCYSLVVLCPFLLVVRRLKRHCSRALQIFFLGTSLITLIYPLSILTIFTWDVARYIGRMGFTPERLTGIVVALAASCMLVLFALWLAEIKPRT